MDDAFFQKVQQALPNFPAQVIRLWLEHGERFGWPPENKFGEPSDGWRGVLGDRGTTFWRTVIWNREQIAFDPKALDLEGEWTVKMHTNAYAAGLPCPDGSPIHNSSERIGRFVKLLQETRQLPVPPILLRKPSGDLEVLDGVHRLAALHHVQQSGEPIAPAHDMWIGVGPPTPTDD